MHSLGGLWVITMLACTGCSAARPIPRTEPSKPSDPSAEGLDVDTVPAPPAVSTVVTGFPEPIALYAFAALPRTGCTLYRLEGRSVLRVDDALYSLGADTVRREEWLERALSSKKGRLDILALGGDFPVAILAARRLPGSGKRLSTHTYLRVSPKRVVTLAQVVPSTIGGDVVELSALPGDRVITRTEVATPAGSSFFADLVPQSVLAEERSLDLSSDGMSSHARLRDGSVALLAVTNAGVQLVQWARGSPLPTSTLVTGDISGDISQVQLLESTEKRLFAYAPSSLFRLVDRAWIQEELPPSVQGPIKVWAMPQGNLLVRSGSGDVFERSPKGVYTRRTWPRMQLKGRFVEARLSDVFLDAQDKVWALGEDGLGLFHDSPPTQDRDLSNPASTGSAASPSPSPSPPSKAIP